MSCSVHFLIITILKFFLELVKFNIEEFFHIVKLQSICQSCIRMKMSFKICIWRFFEITSHFFIFIQQCFQSFWSCLFWIRKIFVRLEPFYQFVWVFRILWYDFWQDVQIMAFVKIEESLLKNKNVENIGIKPVNLLS